MTHGSLFSGIGGFEVGADRAGVETLWNCEFENYQSGVLKKIHKHAEQYRDIREANITRYVDIISGGFPCQDISVAGKMEGIGGGGAAYGPKCLELFGILDLSTSSLKTAQHSLFSDSSESYATFPQSGMMRNGRLYRTSLLDTQRLEKGSTLLPTPTKSDHKATFANIEPLTRYLGSGHQIRLMDIFCQKGFTKCQRVQLLEMVMGFDIGHTELDQSETQSTQP